MPIYQFWCESCGEFDLLRSFADASEPADCPSCQRTAKLVFSVPNLVRTSPLVRYARSREEKSRHEPEIVSEKPAGHSHHHRHGPSRPWQIGHS
jgi:putative FmdB family regulatory protein